MQSFCWHSNWQQETDLAQGRGLGQQQGSLQPHSEVVMVFMQQFCREQHIFGGHGTGHGAGHVLGHGLQGSQSGGGQQPALGGLGLQPRLAGQHAPPPPPILPVQQVSRPWLQLSLFWLGSTTQAVMDLDFGFIGDFHQRPRQHMTFKEGRPHCV